MLEPEDFRPVTQGLREALMGESVLRRLKEIDALHASLEIENALLRRELKEAGEQGEPEQEPGRVTFSVRPFRMGTEKEAALKPLEEASEAYAAWQDVSRCEVMGATYVACPDCEGSRMGCTDLSGLASEIADTITACVNLAARYRLDLQAALDEVEAANKERGRYGGETES